MRRYLVFALLLISFSAHALQSLRVGSQVLVVGDSAARVKELLGNPSVRGKGGGAKKGDGRKAGSKSSGKSKGKKGKSASKGETWQYRRDGHTTIFTIVDGKIAHIDDIAR